MNYKNLLASRTKNMSASAIREILKVLSQPGMVSLAGGIPAPESFPMDILSQLHEDVRKKYGSASLQYQITEGFLPFRESLVDFVARKDIKATADEIYISTGSQQILDILSKVLISKGDKIAVESPTYLGALTAFNPYEPEYLQMDTDENGLIPESLKETLKNNEIKFIYLVPTFQNPTGKTIPLERRKQIAEIAIKYNALILEDDPYGELRYTGETVASIKSFAPDNVIYAGTLSKVFAPGLRLGFYVAPKEIAHWMNVAKQGVDLHTSSYTQALAAEYISGGHFEKHLPNIINLYKPRQEAMLDAMEKYFPSEFKFTRPEGGMFVWAEGPNNLDGEDLYWKGIEENVAFVPGKYFYVNPEKGMSTMRLNFTNVDEEIITKSIEKLGGILKANL